MWTMRRATIQLSAMALAATLAVTGSARASIRFVCLQSGSIHSRRCCLSSEKPASAPVIAQACCEARLATLDAQPGSTAQRPGDHLQAPAAVSALILPSPSPCLRELLPRPDSRASGPPIALLNRALLL
jgi:hypothetical protein